MEGDFYRDKNWEKKDIEKYHFNFWEMSQNHQD